MSDSKKTQVHAITFAPDLQELNGHVFEYHTSLHRLFNKNGWKTQTFLSENCGLDGLALNWKKKLFSPSHWSRRSVFSKCFPLLINIRSFFKMTRSFFRVIANHIDEHPLDKTLLFFETFNTFHLYALALIVPFVSSKRLHIWLLYRYNSKQLFFRGKKDRRLLRCLRFMLPKNHLKLFADTDKLCEELGSFFKFKVDLVPIPHTSEILNQETLEHKRISQKTIDLWWPGVPRRPKGLHQIQKLLALNIPKEYSITLRLSEKTPGLLKKTSLTIEKISENLTRTKYLEYLIKSDIILMPYNLWNYQYSSSGIFIETILSGKIPLVSPGVWMASELKKFNLHELIVCFENPDFFYKLVEIFHDLEVRVKLSIMKDEYKSFHNEQNFADQLRLHL